MRDGDAATAGEEGGEGGEGEGEGEAVGSVRGAAGEEHFPSLS